MSRYSVIRLTKSSKFYGVVRSLKRRKLVSPLSHRFAYAYILTPTAPDIASKLYPHQKKALTFLLERERETRFASGQSSSLWQVKTNAITGAKSWTNLVTQREVFDEPPDCRGALLADDVSEVQDVYVDFLTVS